MGRSSRLGGIGALFRKEPLAAAPASAERAPLALVEPDTAEIHKDPINAPVADFLAELRGQQLLFHPNPGNGGDALIAAGTLQLFRRLGLTVRPIALDEDPRGGVVLLSGGGNFVPLYGDIRTAFERFRERAKLVVLLPHTIRGHEETLQSLGSNCVLFCRDVRSYQHVLECTNLRQVHLAHDMAFNLSAEALFSDPAVAQDGQAFLSETLAVAGLDLAGDIAGRTGFFFRDDVERRIASRPNIADISRLFESGYRLETAERTAWCMLQVLRQPRRVVTDRLHVAIGGLLLGQEVHLFDNSYGKNRAIYQHSLRRLSGDIAFYPAEHPAAVEAIIRDLASR